MTGDVDELIDVDAGPLAAYALWADLSAYPHFLRGVLSVTREGNRLRWETQDGDARRGWDAVFTAEEPGHRLAWSAPGVEDVEITFVGRATGGTRVWFRRRVRSAPEAKPADAAQHARRCVREELERFRELVEGVASPA